MPTNGNRPGEGAAYSVGDCEFSNAAEHSHQPVTAQDISASNSLADLAARIRAEHEAGVPFMRVPKKSIDLTGRRFGRWTVIAYAGLDRRDVDGNYEPSNCGWADRKQQRQHRRADGRP
jgi:hypothetical protein